LIIPLFLRLFSAEMRCSRVGYNLANRVLFKTIVGEEILKRLIQATVAAVQLIAAVLLLPPFHDCAAADEPPMTTAEWRLAEPFWTSPIVYGESSLFVADDSGVPTSRLLRTPKRILKVTRADRSETFTEGTDYVVKADGLLAAPKGSRIPFLSAADLFPEKGAPRSIPEKAGDPSRSILFDNEHWFHDQQVEITYEAAEPWEGFQPATGGGTLTRVLGKLSRGEPVTIAVSGDSISFGLNASRVTGAAPHMPAYPGLFAAQLSDQFHSPLKLVNRAISGWGVGQGLDDLDKLLESHPDLVIVAYGMNHFGARDPDGFRKQMATLVGRIQLAEPQAEILLVAPMWGNPMWSHTPADQYQPHRDAIASLVGPGVAMADVTSLWSDMRKRKSNADLTGNGVNHPNDFGHRVYASALLGQFLGPAKAQ
jgi:acyl-CoA thioesterase I